MKNLKKGNSLPPTDNTAELEIDVSALQGVTQDSREVSEGFLFAALQGENVDGREFISNAIMRGASIILTDRSITLTDDQLSNARLVHSDTPREDFSRLAAQFYSEQPEHIIAVTGTNGKSSVVHFASQLWDLMGLKGAMIGTLNNKLTTPDPVSLFKSLANMKSEEGITHVAIEASSHGLVQHRIDGARLSVGAFTNFSQDHLDFHSDMESYFTAKIRLFEDLLPISGSAVLNADVSEFDGLAAVCKRRGIRVISYGQKGEDIVLLDRRVSGVHQDVSLEVLGHKYEVNIPLVGEFQVMNVLCALGCVLAEYPENDKHVSALIEAISKLQVVPGRLQHVSDEAGLYNAYVDYAHTPDALETVLKALRPHTKGKLICVFGCGGDRDASKRSLMGDITSRLADVAIITDDNPRGEDPTSIRQQVLDGVAGHVLADKDIQIIEGRSSAIERAVQIMEQDDILLLAGKGHEQGQIVGGDVLPFDDVNELSRVLKTKSNDKH